MVYQKPETALKRVEELEAVGQHNQAYALLLEIIISKRTRQTPILVVQPIMSKFIDLSIKLRKVKLAKEGLNQYKNICLQAGQVEATADAVFEYLRKAGEELKRCKSDQDQFNSCKKFLWESYRNVLDTLRNHNSLDFAYQQVAMEAIDFLKENNLKVEFKSLADSLRLHLGYTIKGSTQPNAVSLSDAFTLQRHLDTRFHLLEIAKDMKLWQECYKAVEEILSLLELSTTSPDQKSIQKYFEVLQQVWLFGNDYLFHSAAYQKYFSGLKETDDLKNTSDFNQTATIMFISALAAPNLYSNDDKMRAQRNVRFLLYDSIPPTRQELLEYSVIFVN